MEQILVVDDDGAMRLAMSQVLERYGYRVRAVENGSAALEEVAKGDLRLVISDMRMPGMSGAELLSQVQERDPDLPMVIITAYGTVEDAVSAMKAGARDFLTKPFSPQDLLHLVRSILCDAGSEEGASPLDEPTSNPAPAPSRSDEQASRFQEAPPVPLFGAPLVPLFDAPSVPLLDVAPAPADEASCRAAPSTPGSSDRPMVTRSAALRRVLSIAEGVAASRAPVLIQGESGTGKELLARYIHSAGPRRHQPFVAVNCAALPRELLESELFGHERGAFTGAVARKPGKFELAHRGTILLDEVSEMEPALQAKLLRVLQEHEIDRLGGTHPVAIDARVIATTNRVLRPLVAAGSFRRDLYYRLNVIPLTLPPLRERAEDLDALIDHFSTRHQGGRKVAWDGAARAVLKRHAWPGNVRELEHVVERACLLASGPLIGIADVQLEEEPIALGDAGNGASLAGLTVHEVERRLILETLKRTNNNRSHAARMLGISIRTLRNKLNEYRTATTG